MIGVGIDCRKFSQDRSGAVGMGAVLMDGSVCGDQRNVAEITAG